MAMEQMQSMVTVQVMAVMVEGREVIVVQFSWGYLQHDDRQGGVRNRLQKE